ncbi:BspA family leucine-rich repeat surface protein [Gracilimonas sp.]|uniref:BspA family leucine-rich repeat surface protein n=1 Tax=Gracilimonas sp. TaxID=1974203 RepID=UPI0032EA9179
MKKLILLLPIVLFNITTLWAQFPPPPSGPIADFVEITGLLEVGETLTGSYDYNDPNGFPEEGSTYQWYRLASEFDPPVLIDGATAVTYTLVAEDAGQVIVFEVTPSNGTETGMPTPSNPVGPIGGSGGGGGNNPPTVSNVSISGTLEVGETLTGSYDYDDLDSDPESGSVFTWYRSDDSGGTNKTAIGGADATTYTLVSADEGKHMSFSVIPSDGVDAGTSGESSLVGPVQGESVSVSFAGGTGIEADPYQVETLEQLQALKDSPSLHFVLNNDLDASATSTWNSGAGFVPIGGSTAFTGSLDGQGFVITGLTIDRATEDYVGLFAVIGDGGSVSNIGLEQLSISGGGNTGGLAGENNGTVSGSYANGGVDGSAVVGGLVGLNNSTISESYSAGTVAGTQDIGGLIGLHSLGTVSESYSASDVTGSANNVGGLIGFSYDNVDNSFATGSVSGDTNVGGFAGNYNSGIVSNSYSAGSVTGSTNVGGFIGQKNGFAAATNTFWDNQTSGKANATGIGSTTGITGKTTTEMKTQSIFTDAGWDFTNVWGLDVSKNNGYPNLQAIFGAVFVNSDPTGSVIISGTAQEDETLTASNNLADADGLGAISYQWQRGGIDIAGATASTYTLTQNDVGSVITVAASYTDGEGTAESVTSAGTASVVNVNDVPTGSITISGTAQEDETLTASNTLADEDGLGAITYQWQRGGVDIAGATASTYTLTQSDVGSVITVAASYTDGEGTAESVTSAETSSVANVNDAPTGSVTISGIAQEDETLTASNTLADADGLGTISYQWQRDGIDISGATNSTYTLTLADVGSVITVIASYTDGEGTSESVTSAGTDPVILNNTAPVVSSPIADITVNENVTNALFDLSTTFSDAETASGSLAYTVESNDNPTLVTASIDGSILTLDYQTDQFGTANITVRASDGELFVDETFLVTVNEVNNAPVFAAPYDVSTAVYAGVEFSVRDQVAFPLGFRFNGDGTKMFAVGINSSVAEYTLGTAYDISTAVYAGAEEEFYVGAQEPQPFDLTFNGNGTKMFVLGTSNHTVVEYTLGTIYDVSTAVYAGAEEAFYLAEPELALTGLAFNGDGTKMFVIGIGAEVEEYHLDTAYDVSTALYAGAEEKFYVGAQEPNANDLTFNRDGSKMFVLGDGDGAVVEYHLGTAYDVSTAVYAGAEEEFSVAAQDIAPEGVLFNGDGTKMFMVGRADGAVVEYTLGIAPTTTEFAENGTGTVIDINATDGEGGAADVGLSYSITGGADAAAFAFEAATGILTFVTAPDFENPGDADENNEYVVTIQADDGEAENNTASTTLTITVTDVNETPTVTTPIADVTVDENAANTVVDLSTSFSDAETASGSLTYTIESNGNPALVTATISGSTLTLDYQTDQFGTANITVRASDGELFVDDTFVVTVNEGNNAPIFSAPYDVSAAVYAGAEEEFYVGGQELLPYGLTFNGNGTKMYVIGIDDSDAVVEYTLGVAYDVSTAVYAGAEEEFYVGDQEPAAAGLTFNGDGTKMFVVGTDDAVVEYTLGVAYDVSTAAYAGAEEEFYVGAQSPTPIDLTFNGDGTKMFVVSVEEAEVTEYNLSTAYDVSTAAYAGANEEFVSNQARGVMDLAFNGDGTKMFVLDGYPDFSDTVVEFNLSTAYDISTAVYAGAEQEFYVGGQELEPYGFTFNGNGTKMYVTGGSDAAVVEYSLYSVGAPMTVNFAENGTGTVIDINATDGDGGAVDVGLSYSITGGADAGAFAIEAATGILSFNSSPDFENPSDADTNNVYEVTIQADDGATGNNSASTTLTITVTDVEEIKFFIADNGITVTCKEANPNDTGILGTVTYKALSRDSLKTRVDAGQDVTNVCTSLITNMDDMFLNVTDFNQPIGNWDVSNVTTMSNMFYGNQVFNQDIGNWDVSRVTNMMNMFFGATSFNKPLNEWDVSSVNNMYSMFAATRRVNIRFTPTNFNQPLDKWDVSNVTDMGFMFASSKFNQDLSSWNTASVTNMNAMFVNAYYFNNGFAPGSSSQKVASGSSQKMFDNILMWDVREVKAMKGMFRGAKSFNSKLNNKTGEAWEVVETQEMTNMFYGASSFNQDISGWNPANVECWGNSELYNSPSSPPFYEQNTCRGVDSRKKSVTSTIEDAMGGFLVGSGMSSENASNMFVEWAKLDLQDSVSIDIGDIELTEAGANAMKALREANNITVAWGGQQGVNDKPVFSDLPNPFEIATEDTRIMNLWEYVSDATTPDEQLQFSFGIVSDTAETVGFDNTSGELSITTRADADTFFVAIQVANNENIVSLDTLEVRIDPSFITSAELMAQIPEDFKLHQNYPNPFNPSTIIRYGVPQSSEVRLEVFDMLGRKVATLVNGERQRAGWHQVNFDASRLASGMYLYRIVAGKHVKTRKMMLIK